MRSCIRPVFKTAAEACSFLEPVRHLSVLQKLFADGGYQGPVFQKALAKALPHLEIEIVKRPDHAKNFKVLPQLGFSNAPSTGSTDAGDWPRTSKTSPAMPLAFLRLASIRLMLRKLCNQ
jgi:hypothetical protein